MSRSTQARLQRLRLVLPLLRRRMTRRRRAHPTQRIRRRSAALTSRRVRAPGGQIALTRAARGRKVVLQAKFPKGNKGEKPACAFFAQGKCTRGDKCKFSHGSTGGKTATAASSSEANANPAKKRAYSPKPKPKAQAAAACARYAMFAKADRSGWGVF